MELVRALPKAELHLHIEGTLEPELALRLAKRNNLPGALAFKTVEEARSVYNFTNLQSFLDLYYAGCAVLQTQEDFFDLTWAYLEKAAANKVAHVEAESNLGITGSIVMCYLRHLGAEAALSCLEQALPYKDKIVGVGLDSTEIGFPNQLFEAAFAKAKQAGFRLVAHAGEEGPAENVWQALQVLHVERVDHGIHSLEDAALMQHLATTRMPLTVCPLSNLKLKVYEGELEKRLQELVQNESLCITINSDDPAYFGGYMLDNWQYLLQATDLSSEQIYRLHENSFKASFLTSEQLDSHLLALKTAFDHFSSR